MKRFKEFVSISQLFNNKSCINRCLSAYCL